MPRIAAALGVVATVAICIGLNTHRYPMVWEMVAATPKLEAVTPASPETHLPADSPSSTAPESAPDIPSTLEDAAARTAAPATPVAAQPFEEPGALHGSAATQAQAVPQAVVHRGEKDGLAPVAEPADDHASSVPAPVAEETSPTMPLRGNLTPLEAAPPIVIPGDRSQAPPTPAATDRDLGNGVERLPPVDRVETVQARARDAPLSGDRIVIYPSTGTE